MNSRKRRKRRRRKARQNFPTTQQSANKNTQTTELSLQSKPIKARIAASPWYDALIRSSYLIGLLYVLHLSYIFCTQLHRQGSIDWGTSIAVNLGLWTVDISLCVCAILLSFCIYLQTHINLFFLLRTVVSTRSRLLVLIPLTIGIFLSILGLLSHPPLHLMAIGIMELVWWSHVYRQYKLNEHNYIKLGRGDIPKRTMLNPMAELIRFGDILLQTNPIGDRVGEALGHAVIVIKGWAGKKYTLSCLMSKGVVIEPLEVTLATWAQQNTSWIAMRPIQKLSQEQEDNMLPLALEMNVDNKAWRWKWNRRILVVLHYLVLPKSRRHFYRKFRFTGYDWFGLVNGNRFPNRWTCISCVMELCLRLEIPLGKYAIGILGIAGLFSLRTGLLDPHVPIQVVSDPNFYPVGTKPEDTLIQ